jgi:hypothetical protein
MYGSVVVVLNIGKTLIPGVGVLGIVHAQDVHDHPVDDLGLAICLGWKEVDLVSLVSSSDQRLDQNVLRNRLSRSEIMVCGIPKCTHTHSKKILAVASTVMLFLQAAIITILEKRSTTTKTQSFPRLVDGRPDM